MSDNQQQTDQAATIKRLKAPLRVRFFNSQKKRIRKKWAKYYENSDELRGYIASTLPYLQEAWEACFRGQEKALLSAEERGMDAPTVMRYDDNIAKCESCGVPLVHHLGLYGTCKALATVYGCDCGMLESFDAETRRILEGK